MPFMPDFADTYRPSIVCREESSGIVSFRGASKLGDFDETRQSFTRAPDGAEFQGAVIDSDPPGIREPELPGTITGQPNGKRGYSLCWPFSPSLHYRGAANVVVCVEGPVNPIFFPTILAVRSNGVAPNFPHWSSAYFVSRTYGDALFSFGIALGKPF
jgi:hypothetical protein